MPSFVSVPYHIAFFFYSPFHSQPSSPGSTYIPDTTTHKPTLIHNPFLHPVRSFLHHPYRFPRPSYRHHPQTIHVSASASPSPFGDVDPLTLSELGAPKVLTYGEILYDLLFDTTASSRNDPMAFPGGAPANVAVDLVKLGTPAAILGCIGADVAGKELRHFLAQEGGVNIDGLQVDAQRPTRQVTVSRNEKGERSFTGFRGGQNQEFADTGYDAQQAPGLLFYAAKFFVMGTLGLAFPGSGAAATELLQMADICALRRVIDVNWRPVFWDHIPTQQARATIHKIIRNQADVLKISDEEAVFLYDLPRHVALDHPLTMAKHCPNARVILVTDGEHGSAVALPDLGVQLRVHATDLSNAKAAGLGNPNAKENLIVDTTGCGDAFTAAVIHQMVQAKAEPTDPQEAQRVWQDRLTFANATGALVGMYEGAIIRQLSTENVLRLIH